MDIGTETTLSTLIEGMFYVLLFCYSLYGVFLAYHWFTFGTDRHTSTVALAVYLLGGATLFLTLSATLNYVS